MNPLIRSLLPLCALLAFMAVRAGDLAPPELQPSGARAADTMAARLAVGLQAQQQSQAAVTQDGGDNRATVLQSGLDNQALIQQAGQQNEASILQNGARNRAGIDQRGTLNTARIEQLGVQGNARITQYGNGKTAVLIQR